MVKIFCNTRAAAPAFDLFNVTVGMDNPCNDNPRSANDSEVRAYLLYLAARRSIMVPEHAAISAAGIYVEGDGYIVNMPGYGAGPEVVTLEEMDADGRVVRTSRIGTDKKGHIGLKAAAVVKATGLEKVRKPRAVKPKPAAAPVAASAPQPEPIITPACQPAAVPAVEPVQAAQAAAPVADDVIARLAALEAIVARLTRPVAAGKRVRSEGERRAIIRAWEMRRTMRERADLDRRALEAANGAYRGLLDQYATVRDQCDAIKRQMAGERIAYDNALAQSEELFTRTRNIAARLLDARAGTAARLRKARAAARTAQAGFMVADMELQRLAPVAAAITALAIGSRTAPPASAAAPLRLVGAA